MSTSEFLQESINSIELLGEIIESLRISADFCSMYSANDIGECLYADIGDCKLIFPEEEIAEMTEMSSYYISALSSAFSEKNTSKAISVIQNMISLLENLPSKKEVEKINFDCTLERHREDGTIAVIGDSHTCFFSGNELLNLVSIGNGVNVCPDHGNMPFTSLHLGPCLAYNSIIYGTHNRFLEKTMWLLDTFFQKGEKIVVSLGEVDMRVHVFKECAKQNCTFEKVVKDILGNYFSFLTMLKEKGFRIYIWGPIASQKDIHPNDHSLLPRSGSEQDRNRATMLFSQLAKEMANEKEMVFMSIFDKMIDEDLFTNEQYLCEDTWHLSQSAKGIAYDVFNAAGLFK